MRSYMALTAHWLEDAPLEKPGANGAKTYIRTRSALIAFLAVPESHHGPNLAARLMHAIERYSIKHKVSSVIVSVILL